MKEEILKILEKYTVDSGDHYSPFRYIPDRFLIIVTDDILELLKSRKDI